MHWKLPLIAIATLQLGACDFDEVELSDAETHVLLPEDVELHWDQAFNGLDDGLSAVVPVDIMVYDGASGEPVALAELELSSVPDWAIFLNPDEITTVDPADCEECDFLWDAFRDQYYDMEHLVTEEITPLRMQTDDSGLARVYILVDAFPTEDGESGAFSPVLVQVSLDESDDSFLLVPR